MNQYEEHLKVLQGLRLQQIGRAADLLWLALGELRNRKKPKKENDFVAEWAVHIQCAWRFSRDETIVLARNDLHLRVDSDEPYDWNAGGESRFDQIASTLNQNFKDREFGIIGLSVDNLGGFSLSFHDGFSFSIFRDSSDGSAHCEDWRIFQPDRDGPHFVVP